MHRTTRYSLTYLLPVAVFGAFFASLPNARASERPNVIVFYADDLGTLDAGCYGSTDLYTPNIDRLAASGVRFTRAYAHTVCCPSRALLLTGRHPQRSGVNTWTQGDAKQSDGVHMHLGEITLAEALKGAGYQTGLFGKWHLGASVRHGPSKQGFDEFFGHRGGFIDNYNHYFLHGRGFHDLYRGTTEVFHEGAYFPHLAIGEALRFIRKNRDRPFFAYVAFNLPHYPEQSDSTFEERYKDLPEPRRSYAKVVSTTDHLVGRVLNSLDELELTDKTIVLFMSDNGHSEERNHIRFDGHKSGLAKGSKYGANGGGGNTGPWRGAKGSFFEGGVRVPAILSYTKSLPKGAVRNQAIHAGDFFPSILELCGIPLPDVELDGRSVLPLIKDGQTKSAHDLLHWQWFDRWAVSSGDWKLIAKGKEAKNAFLGKLSGDNPEKQNYAKMHPEIVRALHAEYLRWIEEVDPKAGLAAAQALLEKHDEREIELQLFRDLVPSTGRAFVAGDNLYFLLRTKDAKGRLSFPRLNNSMKRARLIGSVAQLKLGQDSWRWTINLPKQLKSETVLVALELVGKPKVPLEPSVLKAEADGHFALPAHEAAVFGKKLCYEPQPHKNTLGYWVHPSDWARWKIAATEKAKYRVIIHQGCGKGEGGSEVDVHVGEHKLSFLVEDTGHFQNFKPRTIGEVELAPGEYNVDIRPQRKTKVAVMDVRLLRLERIR